MNKWLIVKGRAGLGNRLLCAVTGLLYARLTRRRLYVDWSDYAYSTHGENAFPLLFQRSDASTDAPPAESTSIAPAIWTGRLQKEATDLLEEFEVNAYSSPTIYRKYSVDLSRLDYSEDILVMWCYSHQIRTLRRHFIGEYQRFAGMSDWQIIGEVLTKDIVPNASIRGLVDDYAREHFQQPVIGVHARFTDRRAKVAPLLRAIDKAMRRTPGSAVFLATDSQALEDDFRKRFDKLLVTEKWFPDGSEPMHQNRSCPDRLRHAVEALVDMHLLARCNDLIYPGSSTFSQLSAVLSQASPSRITDTERFNAPIRIKRAIRYWMTT